MKEELPQSESQDPWARARAYHLAVGRIPSLFSACVRTINKVEAVLVDIDNESVRDLALSSAEFLVKVSPTLKAVFYFAARRLHPEDLAKIGVLKPKSLLSIFSPREVASIIGLTFLYRKASKKCDPKEWLLLSRKIQIQMEIGYRIGERMELLGAGNGLLLGGIRFLSVAAFAIGSPSAYTEYRRKMRKPQALFDTELEEVLFGCNHLHVASHIVQALGFCMPRSNVSMSLGMDALNVKNSALPRKVRNNLVSWKGAMSAIEIMHNSGAFIAQTEDYQLKLPVEEEKLVELEIINAIRDPSFDWIAKVSKDLPGDVALQLIGHESEESLD